MPLLITEQMIPFYSFSLLAIDPPALQSNILTSRCALASTCTLWSQL